MPMENMAEGEKHLFRGFFLRYQKLKISLPANVCMAQPTFFIYSE